MNNSSGTPSAILRPRWHFAIFGILAAELVSLPLVAGRGVGLFDFTPEIIPGSLFESIIGIHSGLFEVACYLACGAVSALAFRKVFKFIGHAGWNIGMILGLVLWGLLGLLVALLSPFLTQTPLKLPSEAPDQTLFGMFCFLLTFASHLIFGTLIGASATVPYSAEEAQQDTHPAESEPDAVAPKKAA